MSRKLCKRHLEAYQTIGIRMEVEWIEGEPRPVCTYLNCSMPAIYNVQILTDRVVAT